MSEENSRKRFSIFKKKPAATEDSADSFDESSFAFELKSNNLNTCLIEASAVMKKGKYLGMPLPLRCTWYRATDEKEFVTIDGVTGAFYQPNADDIGCKICVHAVPVSEIQEYIGMPAFSEVGPIQLDPQLQQVIQELLQKNSAEFNLMIQGEKGVSAPRQVKLRIQNEEISVVGADGVEIVRSKLVEDLPKILVNSKNNAHFSLIFKDNRLEMITEELNRDMVVICVRTFCSKSQSLDVAEILLKNQQLSLRLFEANKNYEQSLIIIHGLKEELSLKSADLQYYQGNYFELERELKVIKESMEKINQQNENYSSEVGFLRKDLLLYKEQCVLLEGKLESQGLEDEKAKNVLGGIKDDLETLAKAMNCVTCRVDERIYMIIDSISGGHNRNNSKNSTVFFSCQDDLDVTSEKSKGEDSEYYMSQIKQLKEEFADFMNKAEAEKNFYKRKAESLAVENDKLLSKLGRNPKDISEFALEKQNFEGEKEKLVNDIREYKKSISELENIIKINKRKLDAEIERNFELRKIVMNKGGNSNADYQRIVNSLTCTLTDRDQELASQKKLNKDFMKRIEELERMIKDFNSIPKE